ncbi:hypothetical protein WH96_04350 [Kiloniella spongiae]|uniref:Fido domain-containing protein n=1 Tax=Kiloniella spongiae TaxID=1489064 RepID=A0A0H2MHC9_9PROT|nr:type II toxin-antitoxin system death-on-curing family toxin [Kiloniella spongiae]KLN61586.1 hypothetical protein WH96_04350 [Kiloniella spongiae]
MKWLTPEIVLGIHQYSLRQYGGPEGIRDKGLLISAVQRPKDAEHYTTPTPSIWELAATYCHSIGKNHPFIDGNKRTAIASCLVFLRINGKPSFIPEAEGTIRVLDLLTDKITIKDFSIWLKNATY